MTYSVIVLCGGLGSRLSKIESIKVKILAPIGSKLFIDYFLRWFEINKGVKKDIIFAMGFNSKLLQDYIQKKSLKIKFNIEKSQKGTLPAVIESAKLAKYDDILVLNGDTIFNVNFDQMYSKYKSESNNPLLAVKSSEKDNKFNQSGYLLSNDNNLNFVNSKADLISCGAFFTKKTNIYKELLDEDQWNNCEKFDLDINYLSKAKSKPFLCGNEYMLDIGTSENFYAAQKYIPKYVQFENE